MLHAITHKKGVLYKRYRGHRDDGARAHEEDEVTSLIFGPLAMLPERLSGLFWYRLLLDSGASNLPESHPAGCKMSFWPSRVCNGRRIEPDLLVELQWPSNLNISVMIEFKWRAPLSENQLHKQWQEFFSTEERKDGYHVFIGLETSAAAVAQAANNVWNGKLIKLDWLKILSFMGDAIKRKEFQELLSWIDQVICAFHRIGIKPFKGFSNIQQPAPSSVTSPIFWYGFKGFLSLRHNIKADIDPSFFKIPGGYNV